MFLLFFNTKTDSRTSIFRSLQAARAWKRYLCGAFEVYAMKHLARRIQIQDSPRKTEKGEQCKTGASKNRTSLAELRDPTILMKVTGRLANAIVCQDLQRNPRYARLILYIKFDDATRRSEVMHLYRHGSLDLSTTVSQCC